MQGTWQSEPQAPLGASQLSSLRITPPLGAAAAQRSFQSRWLRGVQRLGSLTLMRFACADLSHLRGAVSTISLTSLQPPSALVSPDSLVLPSGGFGAGCTLALRMAYAPPHAIHGMPAGQAQQQQQLAQQQQQQQQQAQQQQQQPGGQQLGPAAAVAAHAAAAAAAWAEMAAHAAAPQAMLQQVQQQQLQPQLQGQVFAQPPMLQQPQQVQQAPQQPMQQQQQQEVVLLGDVLVDAVIDLVDSSDDEEQPAQQQQQQQQQQAPAQQAPAAAALPPPQQVAPHPGLAEAAQEAAAAAHHAVQAQQDQEPPAVVAQLAQQAQQALDNLGLAIQVSAAWAGVVAPDIQVCGLPTQANTGWFGKHPLKHPHWKASTEVRTLMGLSAGCGAGHAAGCAQRQRRRRLARWGRLHSCVLLALPRGIESFWLRGTAFVCCCCCYMSL